METCPYGSMRLETTGARILETCPWSIGSAEAVRPDELARALARLSLASKANEAGSLEAGYATDWSGRSIDEDSTIASNLYID